MNEGQPRVTVHGSVRAAIIAHAFERNPEECCGLLVGHGDVVDEAVAVSNVSLRPQVEFEVDPAAHIALRKRLRGSGRAIVGAYHSHPDGAAAPSPSDITRAFYPEFVWVIVSLGESPPQVRAFHIVAGRVGELIVD